MTEYIDISVSQPSLVVQVKIPEVTSDTYTIVMADDTRVTRNGDTRITRAGDTRIAHNLNDTRPPLISVEVQNLIVLAKVNPNG